MASAADVWGVRPVEVKEAAARPVVWWEALYGVGLGLKEVGVVGFVSFVGFVRAVLDLGAEVVWPAARSALARATASLALIIFADEPIAAVLMLAASFSTLLPSPSLRY